MLRRNILTAAAAGLTLPWLALPARAQQRFASLHVFVPAGPGVPVASVGLDNPRNAAHLAIRILGVGDGAAPVKG